MESSKHTPPPSPLLSLSIELLDDIFDQAYEEEKPSGPLCRALLPSYLISLYRQIEISSYRQLNLLCQAIEGQSSLGTVVKTLEMDFGRAEDEPSTTAVQFASFLSLLPQLRHLANHHAETILLRMLLQLIAQNKAPNLHRLELTPWDDDDLDEAELVAALRNSSSLTTLHLDSSNLPHDLLVTSSAPLNTKLVELQLSDHAWSTIEPFSIQSLFPALTRLILVDKEHGPDFVDFLRVAPSTLKSLSMKRTAYDYDDEVYDVYLTDDVLPRFQKLEHLELCEYSFSPDSLLLHLRSLSSLSSLAFGPAGPVSNELLLSLVKSPTQLPSPPSAPSPSTTSRTSVAHGSRTRATPSPTQPTAPMVTPTPVGKSRAGTTTDGDGLIEVLWAARRSGIEVVGTAVGAESWAEDHWKERYWCTMEWCFGEWAKKGGKFKEAIDEFGEDIVRNWLSYDDYYGEIIRRDLFGPEDESDEEEEEEKEEGCYPLCL